jgi:ADP-heptose:LPS heptosyltransferase
MAKKVLIYNIGMLGDVLTTIPAHRAIRRHFAGSELTLMQLKVPAGRITPADVLQPQGLVDKVFDYERGGKLPVKEVMALLSLRAQGFDTVCYLAPFPRSEKQVSRDRLFFKLAGIKNLIGFESIEDEVYNRRIDGRPDPKIKHQVLSRLERLENGGISSCPSDLSLPWLNFSSDQQSLISRWLSSRNLEGRPLIAMGIKSAMSSKDWPLERFEELGRQILKEQNASLIIVGGPAEKESAAKLISAWGDGHNACGEFSPLDSGALLSYCQLFIGVDTGTTHLARAAGTPVVSIFSDRAPQDDWRPYGEEVRVLQIHQPCGGCMAVDCPVAGHPCLNQITVPMVMEAVRSLLNKAA